MKRCPSREARILALGAFVEGVAQVANDMELLKQNRGLRGVRAGGVAKRLPHVHHDEPVASGISVRQAIDRLGRAGFRAIGANEPDGTFTNKIADHDRVVVGTADRDFVDFDRHRRMRPHLFQLGAHVLLVRFLYGVSIQLAAMWRIGVLRQRRPT
jgi:hypothetical protein